MTKIKKIIHKYSIAIILITGFLLRIKQFYHFKSVDEGDIINWTWNLFSNPFPIQGYPMLFMYINYILATIYKFIMVFIGAFENSSEFLLTKSGPQFTIAAGRIFTAIIGSLLIYLVYKIGSKFYNKKVGIAAALFVAFNKLMILHSHIFKSDMLVALLMTVVLYFAIDYLNNPKPKTIFFAAFFFGMSFAAKYNSLPIIFLLGIVVVLSYKNQKNKLLKTFFYIPFGASLGFLISSPHWIVHPISNLKLFMNYYFLNKDTIHNYRWKRDYSEMLSMSIEDFIINFSLILIIIFIIGVILTLISRNKTSIVITFYVFLYVLFICSYGFYGDRIGIPAYSAIALIIAKTLFYDLEKFTFFDKKKLKLLTPLLMILVFIYGIINIMTNVKNFNLLKTSSKEDFVKSFRFGHNLFTKKYVFSSQHRTPKFHKDIRLKKNFQKRGKRNRNKKVHFAQCDKEAYVRVDMATFGGPKKVDLKEFTPFFEVNKRKYQPWNRDIIFLYRMSPQFNNIMPPKITMIPKKTFYKGNHTSFFPLKTYEKNPFWGETKKGFYSHWIYSTIKITNFKIFVISSDKSDNIKILINNKEKNIIYTNKNKVQEISFTNIDSKINFHDFIYNINIKNFSLQNKLCFVLQPEKFNKDNKGVTLSDKQISEKEDIPPLFSNDIYPNWVVDYYTKYRIDLTLLKFLNTHELYLNKKNSKNKIETEFYPVKKGLYRIIITGRKSIDILNQKNILPIEIVIYTKNKSRNIVDKINLNANINNMGLFIQQNTSFIKIKIPNTKKHNYLIKKIDIVPDYKKEL